MTWPNGNRYKGNLENDMFHGEGTFDLTDGKKNIG